MHKLITAPPKQKKMRKGGGIRTKKLDEGLGDSVRHLLTTG